MPHRSAMRAAVVIILRRACALTVAVTGALQFASAGSAQAAVFAVDDTADTVDAAPGNGVCADAGGFCTLRAAVQESNALAGADMIAVPAGLYLLTLAGAGEDAAATGDLDVSDTVTITGAGAAATILDGNSLDRLLHLVNASQLTLSAVTVQHGQTGDEGGGLRSDFFGTLIVQDSVITSNVVLVNMSQANAGGGVFCASSSCSLTDTTVSDNVAPNFGGGVAGYFATVNLTDCTVSGNSIAGSGGGGISLGGGGGTIASTTVSDNHANGGFGGGLSAGAPALLLNSTISGNSATDGGGGVHGDDLTISNSTIAFNASGPGGDGGGILVQGAGVTIRNSILASNTDAGGEAPDCGGIALTLQGYNLIGNGTGCTFGGVFSGNHAGPAKLSPLANHGGPTMTHALLPGSPAVDAGNPAIPGSGGTACDAVDQRGVNRPQPGGGRCDIGAYEFVANQCGNYVVEGAEQCDDGNTASDPCCAAGCQLPSCRAAGSSLLLYKLNPNDWSRTRLIWKWGHGDATTLAELGSPGATTDYTLCIQRGGYSAAVQIPAGSSWQTLAARGFKFKDPSGTTDGVRKALLKIGAQGRAKALVQGKGANLPDPNNLLALLALQPVTVQLVNDTNSTCFEATYDSGDVIKNSGTNFKAKAE